MNHYTFPDPSLWWVTTYLSRLVVLLPEGDCSLKTGKKWTSTAITLTILPDFGIHRYLLRLRKSDVRWADVVNSHTCLKRFCQLSRLLWKQHSTLNYFPKEYNDNDNSQHYKSNLASLEISGIQWIWVATSCTLMGPHKASLQTDFLFY